MTAALTDGCAYSTAFVQAVQRLFGQDVPLVATVHTKAHPVTDALKRHPGVELLAVTRAAHEDLLARVTARLLAPQGIRRSLSCVKARGLPPPAGP